MGDISDLRMQILENLQTLKKINGLNERRWVLSCNTTNGAELWTVTLGPSEVISVGTGETIEAAYRDMLKKTAVQLFKRGY